ncbi:WD40-repeat-containing domain protein [Myxozyma melibiosi]|uniref:Ribosome biogenesis protein NSA1 n=1 Tax=Myxozyma melibiosi TaxID=54550 RepID=A0ABR1F280_9ASCO
MGKTDLTPLGKPRTTLTFASPVFCTAAHPSEAVVATGLGTGHVFVHRYAEDDEDDRSDMSDDSDSEEEAKPGIKINEKVLWKTRRHKGSCRAVAFDELGQYIYTAGSDSVLKQASPMTGQVTAKNSSSLPAPPTALTTTQTHVALGTETGTIQFYDPRSLSKPSHEFKDVHEDYVTSITQLAQYQNTYQFISTAETFVARIDIRKGVLSMSEDQEDEILCSCVSYPSNFDYEPRNVQKPTQSTVLQPNTPSAEIKRVQVTAVMGMATGVLTFWEKDNWTDQQNRAILSTESVDCIAEYPGEKVLAGAADGFMRLVDVRKRKTIKVFSHAADDAVVGVACDAWGRAISAGEETVKIWNVEEASKPEVDSDDEKDSDDDAKDSDDDDSDSEDEKRRKKKGKKRKHGKSKQRVAQLYAKKKSFKADFSGLD